MDSVEIPIDGREFSRFVESGKSRLSAFKSVKVQHKSLGAGYIFDLSPRSDAEPLLRINFTEAREGGVYNLAGFKNGFISVTALPENLYVQFISWRKELDEQNKERKQLQQQEELLGENTKRDLETRITSFDDRLVDVSPMASALEYAEKRDAAALSHYREKLMARMTWLSDAAKQIMEGKPGLEPSWTRGCRAAEHLRENGIHHYWHFTDVRNVPLIKETGGLTSLHGLRALGIHAHLLSNAKSQILDKELNREDSVRLSFIPNSYFFHRVYGKQQLVWLQFSPLVATLGEILFCRGNGASPYASVHPELAPLDIDWTLLSTFNATINKDGGPAVYPQRYFNAYDSHDTAENFGRHVNSEVFIRHFVPFEFCTAIYDAQTGGKIYSRELNFGN